MWASSASAAVFLVAVQDALKEAGCEKIFIEQMSGAVTRPALREVLELPVAATPSLSGRRSRSCACATSAFEA